MRKQSAKKERFSLKTFFKDGGKLYRQVLDKTNGIAVSNRIGFVNSLLNKRYPALTLPEKEISKLKIEAKEKGYGVDRFGRDERFYYVVRRMVRHVVAQLKTPFNTETNFQDGGKLYNELLTAKSGKSAYFKISAVLRYLDKKYPELSKFVEEAYCKRQQKINGYSHCTVSGKWIKDKIDEARENAEKGEPQYKYVIRKLLKDIEAKQAEELQETFSTSKETMDAEIKAAFSGGVKTSNQEDNSMSAKEAKKPENKDTVKVKVDKWQLEILTDMSTHATGRCTHVLTVVRDDAIFVLNSNSSGEAIARLLGKVVSYRVSQVFIGGIKNAAHSFANSSDYTRRMRLAHEGKLLAVVILPFILGENKEEQKKLSRLFYDAVEKASGIQINNREDKSMNKEDKIEDGEVIEEMDIPILEQDSISIGLINLKEEDRKRQADPKKVEDLIKSIKKSGLMQPIVINSKNILIDGLHRVKAWEALKKIDNGIGRIPCMMTDETDPDKLLRMQLAANYVRNDLKDRDKWFKMLTECEKRIKAKFPPGGKKEKSAIETVAERTGMKKTTVYDAVNREEKLSDKAKQARQDKKIKQKEADKLTQYPHEKQDEILAKAEKTGKTVMDIIKEMKGKTTADSESSDNLDEEYERKAQEAGARAEQREREKNAIELMVQRIPKVIDTKTTKIFYMDKGDPIKVELFKPGYQGQPQEGVDAFMSCYLAEVFVRGLIKEGYKMTEKSEEPVETA